MDAETYCEVHMLNNSPLSLMDHGNAFATIAGGACEWVSDFWLETDGSQTWADSWEVTVEPDGSVIGTSWYGAETLECEE